MIKELLIYEKLNISLLKGNLAFIRLAIFSFFGYIFK
jgi:hypothetical protein